MAGAGASVAVLAGPNRRRVLQKQVRGCRSAPIDSAALAAVKSSTSRGAVDLHAGARCSRTEPLRDVR